MNSWLQFVLIIFISLYLYHPAVAVGMSEHKETGSSPLEGLPGYDSEQIMRQLQTRLRTVAQNVLPSVVQINVTEIIRQPVPQGVSVDDFFADSEPSSEPVFKEYRRPGLGSGIIVRRQANTYYVVTNNHVLGKADEIEVSLTNGTTHSARIIGSDTRKDLAVVSFYSDRDIPVARLGSSNEMQVGDWAIAAGSPLGLESSLTLGIVSALGRRGGPGSNISDFIQTDAVINPGNSGGALVNIYGEVIGINTWIASTTGTYMGTGFAIPIDNVKRSIEELVADGAVSQGWLGVGLVDSIDSINVALGTLPNSGAFIFNLYRHGPAEEQGLLIGDFITHLNGTKIIEAKHLIQILADLPPRQLVDLQIIRDGQAMTLPIRLGHREKEEKLVHQNNNFWPGFVTVPVVLLADDHSRVLMQIGLIHRGTPADQAEFQTGDLIFGINGDTFESMRDYLNALNSGRGTAITFRIRRGREELNLSLDQ